MHPSSHTPVQTNVTPRLPIDVTGQKATLDIKRTTCGTQCMGHTCYEPPSFLCKSFVVKHEEKWVGCQCTGENACATVPKSVNLICSSCRTCSTHAEDKTTPNILHALQLRMNQQNLTLLREQANYTAPRLMRGRGMAMLYRIPQNDRHCQLLLLQRGSTYPPQSGRGTAHPG